MGAVVIDSSVVFGFLDPDDAHYRRARPTVGRLLSAGSPFILTASVLSEVLVGELRRGRIAAEKRREQLRLLFGPTRPIDDDVAVAAAELRARHRSLRLPDALVIAVGMVDDASAILTADQRWSGVDPRVEVL
ncbi:MAG: type II toxin-antitoxin system VapC family toxin [Micromonosporaceae bacterium]